jgi:hypothetical protein
MPLDEYFAKTCPPEGDARVKSTLEGLWYRGLAQPLCTPSLALTLVRTGLFHRMYARYEVAIADEDYPDERILQEILKEVDTYQLDRRGQVEREFRQLIQMTLQLAKTQAQAQPEDPYRWSTESPSSEEAE